MNLSVLLGRLPQPCVCLFLVAIFCFGSSVGCHGENVIPKEVELRLTSSVIDNNRVAVLQFVTAAAAYITDGKASNIKIVPKYKDHTLLIDIEGYDFTPHEYKPDEVKLPAVLFSKTQLNIENEWLISSGNKEIIISLAGINYRFRLSYSNHLVTLVSSNAEGPIKLKPNVFTSGPSNSISIILWPKDIAVFYITGQFDPSVGGDFRNDLKIFAGAKGYLPADEAYFGLPQPNKTMLYVVARGNLGPSSSEKAERLGSLASNPGVNVYLRSVIGEID